MRLAVFTTRFPGRVATFFSRDMRALLEAGIEIDIFPIYPYKPALWAYIPAILDERVLPRNRVHHIGVRAILGSLSSARMKGAAGFLRDSAAVTSSSARAGVGPLAKSLYVVPKAWAWARAFGSSYDHVHAYWGNYAATLAYLAHRLVARPIPFSFQLHAGADLYFNQVFLREKLLYADGIVTECVFNQRFLQERFGDVFDQIEHKIHVNHMGLDLREYEYNPDGRSPRRVVAVGRQVRTKGYDYLLKAISELLGRGVDVELELVGDGVENRALRALSRRLGIDEKVTFRGWLKSEGVRSAMQQAAVFVHPSSGLGDAKPNVIEEAMALGTPVIASAVTGIPELLDQGRCGVLVPPRDVRALADGLETLLAKPDLRRTYAEAARRHAEETLDLWRNGARLAHHLGSLQRS